MKQLIVLLLFFCTIIVSCVRVQEQSYTYSLYELNNSDGSLDSLVKTIIAINDSCAYAKAYESFSISDAVYKKLVRNNGDFAKFGHKPVSFRIQDSEGNDLTSINQIILSDIRNQILKSVLGVDVSSDLGLDRSNNSFSNSSYDNGQTFQEQSSSTDWRDRMDTEEYNRSLAREMMLRQAGMKDAARIERTQRNKYLRDGGYDSKDGGKQIHYKGSVQQKRDLDAIDKYMEEHPDF